MKGFTGRWVVPMLAGVALLVAGCESPPEAEKKAADAALAAARSSGADMYAAPAYKSLSDLAKQADTQMADKKYKEAKASYERVKTMADETGKAAMAGKAAMKAEVEKGIAAAEAAWMSLEKQAQAASKKLKPDVKKAWTEEAKATQEALKAAKDALAASPAQAKEKLAVVLASIEKWTKDLTGMTAMPAAPPAAAKKAPVPAAKK
jgi:hypothetical protein